MYNNAYSCVMYDAFELIVNVSYVINLCIGGTLINSDNVDKLNI